MIEQNNDKLLEKINQNILNLNNFKNLNKKSISCNKLYYQNLIDFYFFVNKQNNLIPKSNIEHFSNNKLSYSQIKEINEIYNPVISKLNKKLNQKNKEYQDKKIKFNYINNSLDKNIENLEYIYKKKRNLIESFDKDDENKDDENIDDAIIKAEEDDKPSDEEAKSLVELLKKKKIEEAIKKVTKETEEIKKQITNKLTYLNSVLDMIKKIQDEILKVKNKIINSVSDANKQSAKIIKNLPKLYKKIISEKTKKANTNYKNAAKIKNDAIKKAQKDLDNAYKEARRIKSQNKSDSNIEQNEPIDTSDYELSAKDANKDLDVIKNTSNVKTSKIKFDLSPFILIFIIIGIVFFLHEFVLPPLE